MYEPRSNFREWMDLKRDASSANGWKLYISASSCGLKDSTRARMIRDIRLEYAKSDLRRVIIIDKDQCNPFRFSRCRLNIQAGGELLQLYRRYQGQIFGCRRAYVPNLKERGGLGWTSGHTVDRRPGWIRPRGYD